MKALRTFKMFLVACLLTIFGLYETGVPSSAYPAEIAILKSSDIAAYHQAISSFKVEMSGHTFVEYDLQGDLERGRRLARQIRASAAALVLAVGLKAARAAKLEIVDTQVVFCMVLDPAEHDLEAPNMTGVLLEVPIERQFTTIRSVLPRLTRLGVLYDPVKTAKLIEEAKSQAKRLGIELVARQVPREKELPAALRAILPKIEALWLVPDATVLTDDSLGYILGTALDSNVPVIGFSAEFVRRGALLGFYVKYDDLGRQASRLAKKILAGQDFSSIATIPTERLRLSLNLKTARFLGISIPPDVVNRADEVY